jgi:Bifunctional DNA primase/polymerase, N-terminal
VDTLRTTLRASALRFANQGWHVFPLTPGAKKPPVIDRWEHRASTDSGQIDHWWREIPFNVGIATGPSGLVVVDLDTAKPSERVPAQWAKLGIGSGAATLRELTHQHNTRITPTFAVHTPSRGWHLYYSAPAELALRNTQGVLGWKIDTRARGGYVVAPGSRVPSGAYELIIDREVAELPGWLHQALTPDPPSVHSAAPLAAATSTGGYTLAALRGEAERVRSAPPGQHNAMLCRAAYALGQLVGAGLLTEEIARAELTAAADALISVDCDCTPREITRVITAGLAAGARNPRRTGPRRVA